MRKLILAMTAVSGLAIAAPAAAQYGYPAPNNNYQYPSNNSYGYRGNTEAEANFEARFEQWMSRIEDRVEAGVDARTIDRIEARNLRAELRTLTRLEARYSIDGFNPQERADLMQRMRSLRQNVRVADGGADDRYGNDERYGYGNDRYGTQNGYTGRGGPYDADGDGWDDRDCDRNGTIDNRACTTTRGGLGGILDNVLGTGGLQVGQRVTGNLYSVPNAYSDRYRDDYRYYYRSDGRRIYQIDVRTDTVVRVYPM